MEAGKGAAPIGPGLQGNRVLFQDLGWDGRKPIEGQAPRLGGGALRREGGGWKVQGGACKCCLWQPSPQGGAGRLTPKLVQLLSVSIPRYSKLSCLSGL